VNFRPKAENFEKLYSESTFLYSEFLKSYIVNSSFIYFRWHHTCDARTLRTFFACRFFVLKHAIAHKYNNTPPNDCWRAHRTTLNCFQARPLELLAQGRKFTTERRLCFMSETGCFMSGQASMPAAPGARQP
jgi:hypothetical protein